MRINMNCDSVARSDGSMKMCDCAPKRLTACLTSQIFTPNDERTHNTTTSNEHETNASNHV
jgi:hypothetical protein